MYNYMEIKILEKAECLYMKKHFHSSIKWELIIAYSEYDSLSFFL